MASKSSTTCPGRREGYPSLCPYLVVHGAERCIDFMEKAFGAKVLFKHYRDEAEGTKTENSNNTDNRPLMHAEVRIDDSVIMLGDATEAFTPALSHLYLYVENVDEVYKRALSLGATSVQEPCVGGGMDLDKRGGVKDPAGNTWWIATAPSRD